jgi:hypothetical protein
MMLLLGASRHRDASRRRRRRPHFPRDKTSSRFACARRVACPSSSSGKGVFCSRKASFVHVVTVDIALSIAFDDVGASRSSFMGGCDDSLEAKKGKKCSKKQTREEEESSLLLVFAVKQRIV